MTWHVISVFILFIRHQTSLVYFPPYESIVNNSTRNITLQYLMITGDEYLERAEIVWNTWGKTIMKDHFIALSDSERKRSDIPIVQVMNISSTLPSHLKYRLSQLKWLYGIKLMRSKEFDWLIFLDDDTFIIHNSLLKLLSHYNSSDSLLIGKAGEPSCHLVCGGAGFALSQQLVYLLNTKYSHQFEHEYHRIISSNATMFFSDVIISHFILKHQVGIIRHHEEFKNFPPEVGLKWYDSHNRTPSPVVSYHRLTPKQYYEFYSIYYLNRTYTTS